MIHHLVALFLAAFAQDSGLATQTGTSEQTYSMVSVRSMSADALADLLLPTPHPPIADVGVPNGEGMRVFTYLEKVIFRTRARSTPSGDFCTFDVITVHFDLVNPDTRPESWDAPTRPTATERDSRYRFRGDPSQPCDTLENPYFHIESFEGVAASDDNSALDLVRIFARAQRDIAAGGDPFPFDCNPSFLGSYGDFCSEGPKALLLSVNLDQITNVGIYGPALFSGAPAGISDAYIRFGTPQAVLKFRKDPGEIVSLRLSLYFPPIE
jgi:hypothetical protein